MNKEIPRLLPIVLAVAGLVVCGVLEWIHAKTYLMPSVGSFCTVNETLDCGAVALSRMSVVMNVPMPLWGAAGFVAMLLASWRRSWLLWPLAGFSALASVALLLESLLHVGTVCLMCEGVHVLSILLAVVAWRWHRRHGQPVTGAAAFAVLGIPAAIIFATAIIVPPYWVPLTWQQGVPVPHGETEEGHHWVGAQQPETTLEEFVDYGCPHCAIATNRTRRTLSAAGDRLRVIRRHQPRMRCNETNHGCLPQRAAHCAGKQDKFWEMDAWLFAHVPGHADADMIDGARRLGLDEPTFMSCIEDPATYTWADDESRAARKAKIKATPTYRIDGRKLTVDEVEALFDGL
ncbi:MAG: thioredoxin domain-containing protein [Deltaproteobacteria bacterium]|nr:thioredoxin domain-containing protein [Deltaproteobacteria bacterium]